MAQRDFSRPIQMAGITAPPEGVHEEIVCYTVITGRGKALVRHMRNRQSEDFAKELVAALTSRNQIRDLIEEFEETEFANARERRRARADLVREIKRIVYKRPTL